MCTIAFVFWVPLLRAHSRSLTRTHFVFDINHRLGSASGTAHRSCFSRFVVKRLSFPTFAFFVCDINHRFGFALGTVHRSCFSRFVVKRPSFPASAFFVFDINHRPGFALGAAHGSCLSRFVVSRKCFPASAFFAFDINHRCGFAPGTAHGSCFSRFVVNRLSFPAPADSILRFHLTKTPVSRTPFRFSVKITVGCRFSAIQVLTQLRHGGITMNVLFFK